MGTSSFSWQVAGITTFYMVAALTMVMANKWVLNTSTIPLTFLCIQLALCIPLLHILSLLPSKHKFHFTIPRWTKSAIVPLLPVCAANVAGLIFNTYCLKLVDASYFQVARGLQIPATVMLSALVHRGLPSTATVLSCMVVSWGFVYTLLPPPLGSRISESVTVAAVEVSPAGVDREISVYTGEAPILGMILGILSAVMIAVHAILIESALVIVERKTLVLAYWSNVLSAIALLPVIVFMGEIPEVIKLLNGSAGSLAAFIEGSAITGFVGFLMCVAGLLSIKVTSPVTHMYSSAVRSVLQVVLGVWLFGDVINSNRIISIFLVCSGSMMYVYSRMRETPDAQTVRARQEVELKEALLRPDPEKGLPTSINLGSEASSSSFSR